MPKAWCSIKVCYEEKEYSLPLLVLGGEGPALLGRNWLEEIKLNWPKIKQLYASHKKRLETKAKFNFDPTATPIFHKARLVTYALRKKIEQDLERLEKAGTIEPVQYSEWATPIFPVRKQYESVEISSLLSIKASKLDNYHITKLDALCTKLAGAKCLLS